MTALDRVREIDPMTGRGSTWRRIHRLSFWGHMFQASMWRDYAMTWHGRRTRLGEDREWCEVVGRMTYAGCLRLARVHVYLASRIRRAAEGGGR